MTEKCAGVYLYKRSERKGEHDDLEDLNQWKYILVPNSSIFPFI